MALDIKVIDIQKSLDYIQEHHSSVARFGDGEMDIIAGRSIPYQTYDATLAQKLKEILATESSPQLLVCQSDVFERLDRYNQFCRNFWTAHLDANEQLYTDYCTASWYGSTFISRPYMDLEDKSQAVESFKKIRQLWQDKELLIVEGETSRSGVGNDLFDNSKSISRIICPSKNAYSYYDTILETIEKYAAGKFVLIMLGPTAKVLARDLSQKEIQAIDLGHIDSEYEWFKMGATSKVKLSNKHTAENNFDENIIFDNEEEVAAQVVARIIDDREKVSVIVPVYNSENYLRQCLDSIVSQTYKNLEIILVNDGSTDNSGQICEEYRSRDSRFKVHHKKNGGVGSSRNAALNLVTGDYILFIDNDDWIDNDHIESLHRLMKKTDADVAAANFTQFMEEESSFAFHISVEDYFEEVYTPQEWFTKQYESQFYISQVFTVPWGKLYKASLYEDIMYPEDRPVEDDLTTWKAYLLADRIAYMNKPIYTHRKLATSVTGSVNPVHTFPLESIAERIVTLSLLGFDISGELAAYHYRRRLHSEWILKTGDIKAYKDLQVQDKILAKYGKQ